MNENYCAYCSKKGEFLCECSSSLSIMCSLHVANHIKLIGQHDIKQIGKKKVSFSPETKSNLLRKVLDIKSKAKDNIYKALKHVSSITTMIELKFTQFSKHMKNFIECCDEVIDYVENMPEEIKEKRFYTPLENFLMAQGHELLDQISEPKINLGDLKGNIIEYSISAFPNCLFEYCNNAILMLPGKETIYNNGLKEIKKNVNTNFKGRILAVQNNLIIFTGGNPPSTSACLINLSSGLTIELPSLKRKRTCHGMTWIDGLPAVIGGHDGKNTIAEVEVLIKNYWKNYPSMNMMRNSFSAISVFSKVFVFGGLINEFNAVLNSVEKYENGSWKELGIKMIVPLIAPGICACGYSIFIFGGTKMPIDEVDECADLDYKKMSIRKINPILRQPMYFTQNIRLASNGEVLLYGFKRDNYEHSYCKLNSVY